MKIKKPDRLPVADASGGRGFDSDHSVAKRDFAFDLFMVASMFALNVGCVVYAIIRDSVLDERYGKGHILAHASLYGAFIIDAVLLVAPFIGACNAFRLTRSVDRSAKIIGWLFVMFFALSFLQSAMIEWTQYQNDQRILSE